IKYLYMKTKFGLNPSHLVESDARAWQENEIDPYLKGVLSLPSFMLPMSENRQFIHDKHDKGNTMANATITFFSGLDDKSNEQKEYTSFHEMAHYISGELEIDHDPEWLALSGWKEDLAKRLAIESGSRRRKLSNELSSRDNSFGSVNLSGANNRGIGLGSSNLGLSPSTFGMEEIKIDFDFEKSMLDIQIFHYAMEAEHPHRCVSQYGETNPAEDFAESVAAYRYNPEALKNASLEKYEFIKNKVFQGVEFDSSEKCSQFF
ncbi:MAG: hypothetical protein WEB87_00920, partial [Bacteriovoracaceae bacterium]